MKNEEKREEVEKERVNVVSEVRYERF